MTSASLAAMVSVNSPTAVSPRTSAKLSGSTLPSPASIDAKQAALKRALSAAPFLARTEGDFAASSRIPSMAAIPDDLALALELADLADMIILRRYRADDLVVETKPDLTPVTEADRDTERALREQLTIARPADSVIGEEYGVSTAPDSTRRWILDPIDGTKNYVRGIPVWATLIALEEDGRGTVGVVSAPALHRRWGGAAGGGALGSAGRAAPPEAPPGAGRARPWVGWGGGRGLCQRRARRLARAQADRGVRCPRARRRATGALGMGGMGGGRSRRADARANPPLLAQPRLWGLLGLHAGG